MTVLHFNNSKYYKIEYPIGANFNNVIDVATKYSDVLLQNLQENHPPNKNKIFINIWVKGSSGAILGTLVGKDLSKFTEYVKICHIKKVGEKSHNNDPSYYQKTFEDTKEIVLNMIIDDFIESGYTINSIEQYMSQCEIDIVDYLCLCDNIRCLDQLDFKPSVLVCY